MKGATTRAYNMATCIWIALFLSIPFIFHSVVYEGSLLPKLAFFQTALCLLCLSTTTCHTLRIPPAPLFLSLILFTLLNILSVFQAINPIEALLQLSQHVLFFLLPIFVIQTLSIDQFHRVIHIAPWAGLPIALLGICQYLGWEGLPIPSNAHPSATFFHRNAAAAYIICIFPLAWVGFQCAQTRAKTLCYTLLMLVLGIFLIYTRTRAAWVGLLTSGIIVYLLSASLSSPHIVPLKRLKRLSLFIIVILFACATFIPDNIQGTHRVHFDEKKSDTATTITSIFTQQGHRGRLDLWKHTLSMIAHHPLGVGLGNWQFQYPYFARGSHINVKAAPERPHNDLLWITAELGLVGVLAFLCLIAFTIRLTLPLFAHASFKMRTTLLGLLAVMGAYLIDGLFSFPRGQITPTLFFYFALGGITLLATPQLPSKTWSLPHKGVTLALLFLCLTITLKRIQYDTYHQRVHTAERKTNWSVIIPNANQARQIGTYRANTFIAQGRAFYHLGNLNAAETAYKTGLKLHPNSLNAYNNLGIVYRQQGKNEQAEQAFLKALYLHPNFIEASYNLGNVYSNLARWDDAWHAYQKAHSNGLNIPQLYFKLGKIAYLKGNKQQAEQYFFEALKRDAHFSPAIQALEQIKASP